mgnify:CR=1 FL=1
MQFLGAMNDNVFKQALVILLAYQTASFTAMSSDTLQNLAQALFILPFFLFSATAGQLADKYEKSTLITVTVALELADHGARRRSACCSANLTLLLVALFLGGVQSALFGPVKYAILPQHLKDERAGRRQRPGRDGHLGRDPARHDRSAAGWSTQPGWGVAGVGGADLRDLRRRHRAVALHPESPPRRPGAADQLESRSARPGATCASPPSNRTVFLSMLGISWFWFYGAMLRDAVPEPLAQDVLGAATSTW